MLDPTATVDDTDLRDEWCATDEPDDARPPRDPLDEDRKGYELIHGTWVEKPEMGANASKVLSRLSSRVSDHVDRNALGDAFEAECGFQLFPSLPKLIRKPDVSFVAAGRFPNNIVPQGNAKLAPDFAAEVVSPNDAAVALEQKIDEYLRAGVRLVWVVYPLTKAAYVYRPDGTAARKTVTDSLDGEAVLPGLTVPVADLFVGL